MTNNESRTDVKPEGEGGLFKGDKEDYQKELDKSINYLLKRITWLLAKLETLQDDINTYNKTANAIGQLVSALDKLFALRGISFETGSGESLAELLSKLPKDVRKKVEEVIKDAKTQFND